MYPWGSKGVTVDLESPMRLTIRFDEVGESITIGTEQSRGDDRKMFGTLQPGETFTITLHKIRGAFAHCDLDTQVSCTLMLPSS